MTLKVKKGDRALITFKAALAGEGVIGVSPEDFRLTAIYNGVLQDWGASVTFSEISPQDAPGYYTLEIPGSKLVDEGDVVIVIPGKAKQAAPVLEYDVSRDDS